MQLVKNTNFDFLGKRRVALTASAALIVLIYLLVPFRLNLGVDFAGGTEIEVQFAQDPGAEAVREKATAAGFADAQVQRYGPSEDRSYLVRVERISIFSAEEQAKIRESLQQSLAAYEPTLVQIDPNVGDKIDLRTKKPVPQGELRAALEAARVPLTATGDAVRDLTRGENPSYQILTEGLTEKVSASLEQAFGQDQVDVRRVEFVGPQVGEQLRNRGIMAVLLSMVAILIYVAFRFQPKYAPGGVVALFHDISIVVGFYVVSGREFNLTSIAVLLTIVGYSINDTIVIFDRVREIENRKTGKSLTDIINQALNETLSRTIVTSLVTAISLVGLLVYGVGSIWDFAAAMLVGLLSGTYSTIYVAGPFAVWIDAWMKKREAAQAATAPQGGKPASQRPARQGAR